MVKFKNITVVVIICLFLFICLVCSILFFMVYPIKYKEQIITYSNKYNLDKSLVASIICVESRFNKNATSTSGACGLMQLIPSTYNWIATELNESNIDIYNQETNIKYGCYYLRYLIDKYDNLVFVLACYNAGEGVVTKWGDCSNFYISDIQYKETYNYVNKVISLEKLYRSRF